MSVTFTTLNRAVNFRLTAQTVEEMAPAVAAVVLPSRDGTLTAELEAATMDALIDAVGAIARLLDDADRIAAIRVDELAFIAELDFAPRPVDPRRLN